MLVRRDQRSFLEQNWQRISHMEFLRFEPDEEEDIYSFSTEKGANVTKIPKMTQSWSALVERATNTSDIPKLVTKNTGFFLFFLLVCPHRANTKVVRALDLMK